jgi:hypothetical protein
MKLPLVTLSFLAFLLNFAACTKSAKSLKSTENEQLGAGEWNLVSDSTYEGAGLGNHPVDYIGQPGDYFSFTTDGHVYTREGGVLDTLTYKVVSDSTIIISDFGIIINGVPDTSRVTGLGADSLTTNNGMNTTNNGMNTTAQTIAIESPFFPTPGGVFGRKVTLSR